jgi:hypothetical protein
MAILPAACGSPYVSDCRMPTLRAAEPLRVLRNVGDDEDQYKYVTCPVPLPTKFEADRPYGKLRFEWWGSRLYMSAEQDDGQQLDIRGDGIEHETFRAHLIGYSHRKRFPFEHFIEPAGPEIFTVQILGADGLLLDEIDFTAENNVVCRCAFR